MKVKEEALLLLESHSTSQTGKIAKVLDFFGVPWRPLLVERLSTVVDAADKSARFRLFCSSNTLLSLIPFERSFGQVGLWQKRIHSVFAYSSGDPEHLQKIAKTLTRNDKAFIAERDPYGGDFLVSNEANDVCGAMAGVKIAASKTAATGKFALNIPTEEATALISMDHGSAFLKLTYRGVTIFLSTSGDIIDLDCKLAGGVFDIRDHVLTALPVVLYIKWAFPASCWSAPETNACLIIDDPLLKPTYGFLNFTELLSLMKRHAFCTNIAFIPWNWRRSDPTVVRLFQENSDLYSVSIHGCDHTRAEFGGSDPQKMYWKVKRAMERMNQHQSSTGIRHEPVMVFPQGVFSEATLSALKHTEFIAAVNNDTISVDVQPRAIPVSEVWAVALMSYSEFPLFTRRYPWEGIENFAFDILLGKPALIAIHHDFCRNECVGVVDFVERLNALNHPVTWRSLGEVIRRSFRLRKLSEETEVEIYGTESRLENRSEELTCFVIKRRESAPSLIEAVYSGSQKLDWRASDGCIHFQVQLEPHDSTTIRVAFHALNEHGRSEGNAWYNLKTMLRRYLSEARDYSMSKSKLSIVSRFFEVN